MFRWSPPWASGCWLFSLGPVRQVEAATGDRLDPEEEGWLLLELKEPRVTGRFGEGR